MFRLASLNYKKVSLNNQSLQFIALFPCLVLLIYFSIISTILGTFVLNLTLITFDIIFLIFFYKNIKKIQIDVDYKFLLIVLLVFLSNIILSENISYSLKTFLNLIKNFVFLIGCYVIFKIDKKVFIKFINLIVMIFIFVACDVIFQYLTGKDFFGFEKSPNSYGRLSGPFGDELIVGSFLSKIIFIAALFFLINFKKKYYDIIFILVGSIVIFLTKERSASIMTVLTMFLYVFFRVKSLKLKILSTVMIFSIIFAAITFIPNTSKRLKIIYYEDYTFLDTQWGAHFLTAFEIFKKNPLIGSGLRTFRYECTKKYTENIPSKSANSRCTTHPHNFYFEILSDLGITGFILFLFFLFKILTKILSLPKKSFHNDNIIISASLLFLFFWPIKTTGSIFSSWNSYFYILALIIIFYQTNFVNLKDK